MFFNPYIWYNLTNKIWIFGQYAVYGKGSS